MAGGLGGGWQRSLALLLLATAAPASDDPPRQQRDPQQLVAAMTAAAAKHARVRALVRNETRVGDRTSVRFFESFIDVRGGRVRTLQRDDGRATPHLLSVHDGERLRQQQLELGEVAESVKARPLLEALKVVTAGELVVAAFDGRPPAFEGAGLVAGSCDGPGESIGGVGCTRLVYVGATSGALWIADGDRFPRRLAVTLDQLRITEEIVELEFEPDWAGVEFAIVVPEGRKLRSIAEARAAWSKDLGPEESRWPHLEDDAPDFAAVDLESRVRLLSETGGEDVIVAFWNPEVPASVEQAITLDAAWSAAPKKAYHLWHVAAGRRPEPVREALAGRTLAGELVVAGEHAKNAFQQFSVWQTPAFARITDMFLVEMTRDPSIAAGWLR